MSALYPLVLRVDHLEMVNGDDGNGQVYSEFQLWLRLFEHRHWDWDYFINLSGADIPVLSHDQITSYLTEVSPTTFLYYHENKDEFRQQHVLPSKRKHTEVRLFGRETC